MAIFGDRCFFLFYMLCHRTGPDIKTEHKYNFIGNPCRFEAGFNSPDLISSQSTEEFKAVFTFLWHMKPLPSPPLMGRELWVG